MHAAPTAVPVDLSPRVIEDPLASFTKHRRFNRPIAMALHADWTTSDVGRAIANCSGRLSLDVPLVDDQLGEPLLRGAYLCNRRLCPFCEWRRTRAWRARVICGLDAYFAENTSHKGLFLTLTVKNCPLQELRPTLSHMHASWKRLSLIAGFPAKAWMRRTEITVQRCRDVSEPSRRGATQESALPPPGGSAVMVHPHLHCLLLVNSNYFTKGYRPHLWWQQQWQMAARLDYAPVVDVRRARPKRTATGAQVPEHKAAVIEAAKYATKATDLIGLGDALPEFHHAIARTRLVGISSSLQRYVRESDPAGDDLLDIANPALPPDQQCLSAVAQWFDEAQEYRFVI